MLFNSFIFLLAFLPITYLVFWTLLSARARYVWLAITGYVFYGYWDPRFCLLMAFSTMISYLAGRGFLRYTTPRARRLCLVVPITVDLCLLGFFKYANFTLTSVHEVVHVLGWDVSLPNLNIILPVGISFYTFHTISYIVDCYRGTITPTKNIFEFAAYVSLFSQLVAGPIVRFRQIEADLEALGTADRQRWLPQGVSFFIIGMVEKVIIADSLGQVVDTAFSQYTALSTAGVWLAMLGYSFQLYFDFCGYSDMAVGLGYMFGLRIPQNFHSPYKALDPSDFWQRWHISLSSCLRDYLYIPLGGNRHGQWATYRNLMLTMLIGGLWHGANWTFVIWGAYHGGLLLLHRRWHGWWDGLPARMRQLTFFVLVLIGWVFFRSEHVAMALHLLQVMFIPTPGLLVEPVRSFLVMLSLAIAWGMFGPNAFDWHAHFHWRPRYAYTLAAAFGMVIAVMLGGHHSPFLYFQF
jgi:alginate O-acetyltransferase complex protein AlgI